ncbi:MAG: hypothetical protein NTX75_00650 [Proteobacteria bacterium]|nr:hypothetical protein [Pseudomonadota bacterium]
MHRIYAVTGNPVFHSRSPDIFNEVFRAFSIDAVYTRLAATGVKEIMDTTKEVGIYGLNITSPFKEEIVEHLDAVEDNARRIGAVNTVVNKKGRFIGYNTDIAGVLGALRHNNIKIKGMKAVVLGASGAGKAAVCALLSSGAHVTLINRTYEKAKEAAEILGCSASPIEDVGKSVLEADIFISCISTSKRVIEPSFLRKGLVVLDADYSKRTPLQLDAKSRGCKIIDGREWLLFQALPAFTLFTNKKAPVDIMRRALYRKTGRTKNNIALIGFMGVGKSTIAERLARFKNMIAVDIDNAIEEKTGFRIEEIFKHGGEETFRRMESKEVFDIKKLAGAAITCGGGIVLDRQNVDIIKNNCIPVWLWAKIETILDRIRNDSARPLLNVRNREARARSILKSRLHLYAHTADLLINTEQKSPEEIAERIWNEINGAVED